MKVGVFWRKFRNVEQQMRITPLTRFMMMPMKRLIIIIPL